MQLKQKNQASYFLVSQIMPTEVRRDIQIEYCKDSKSENSFQLISTQNIFPHTAADKFPSLRHQKCVQFHPVCQKKLQELIQICYWIDVQNHCWFISSRQIESWIEILSHTSQAHCREIYWAQRTENSQFTVSVQKQISRITFCDLRNLDLIHCMIVGIEIIAFLDAPKLWRIKIGACPFVRSLKAFAKCNFPWLSDFMVTTFDRKKDPAREFQPLTRTKVYGQEFYMSSVQNFYTNRQSAFELTDWRYLIKLQHIKTPENQFVNEKKIMKIIFNSTKNSILNNIRFLKGNHKQQQKLIPPNSHMSSHIWRRLLNKANQFEVLIDQQ